MKKHLINIGLIIVLWCCGNNLWANGAPEESPFGINVSQSLKNSWTKGTFGISEDWGDAPKVAWNGKRHLVGWIRKEFKEDDIMYQLITTDGTFIGNNFIIPETHPPFAICPFGTNYLLLSQGRYWFNFVGKILDTNGVIVDSFSTNWALILLTLSNLQLLIVVLIT